VERAARTDRIAVEESNMAKAFSLVELVKTYPGFQLGPIDLDLEPGTVLGYVGPNASGKTTTFHCIMGLARPESGRIEIFGRENTNNSGEWKLDVGYVGDLHVFHEGWTAEEHLRFRSQFYRDWSAPRAADLARRFGLPLDRKAKALSSGNRVKLSLVSALAHNPKLLLLDEPTSGLDPVVRREVLDVLFEVLEDGERSIFYATHILPDISRLADELAFLSEGRIIRRSRKEDLLENWRRITFTSPRGDVPLESIVTHEREGATHRVTTADRDATVRLLKGAGVDAFEETRMTIEDIAVEILKGGQDAPDH
jgi:ABC-2 type transport system ATP-binding protein